MTRLNELKKRVASLEQAVNHLTSHHDEEYLVVHDDVSADTCKRIHHHAINTRRTNESKRTKRRRRP